MILIPESEMRFVAVNWQPNTPHWVKVMIWIGVGMALGTICVGVAFAILASIFNFF